MSVNPVSLSNTNLSKRCEVPNFTANTNEKPVIQPSAAKVDSADKFISKIEKMPPAAVGLSSAVLWFGVGMGLDKLIGMVFKSMKSSLKTSLIMNGIFGAVMGGMSYWRAKKEG